MATAVDPRRRVVFLLGGCAGYLDAVGYLTFGLFVANMTGNTVLLGIFGGRGQWSDAGRAVLTLASFFSGALLGAAAVRRVARLADVLRVEACLLVGAVATWAAAGSSAPPAIPAWIALTMIVLLGLAMGAQAAAVRRVGRQRVSTTYVTGTLVSLAVDAAAHFAPPASDGAERPGADPLDTLVLLVVWASYLAGAVVGGLAETHAHFWAVLLAAAVIVVLAGWDLRLRASDAGGPVQGEA